MAEIPRRTIDELLQRYELEPDIADIFVEGSSDQNLIRWILDRSGNSRVSVYEIDTVDVPMEEVTRRGFTSRGNRQEVITLACKLSEAGVSPHQVACIADRDFDTVRGQEWIQPVLIFTDYANMEMYLFNADVLGKFLLFTWNGAALDPQETLDALAPALQALFLMRLANDELGLCLDWPKNPHTCCSLEGRAIHLDQSSFAQRWLSAHGEYNRRSEFLDTVQRYRCLCREDPRYQMNGHDYTALLAWYLKQPKHHNGHTVRYDGETMEATLYGCANPEDYLREELFQSILNRLCQRNAG